MLIMNGDKIVARLVRGKDNLPVFRAEPWTTFMDTPLSLFGFEKREVSMQEFVKWTKTRCFPESRIDKEDLLKELGLDRYDTWEIVKKTRGELYAIDEFWIDFDN